MANPPLPNSILIVGGGVFGLSTALALCRRHTGKITLVESSQTIPNPEGSSVDSSRIIRADYADPAYSRLAESALQQWRTTEWGCDGRYNQNGLVFVASQDGTGQNYVKRSYENVKAINPVAIQELPTPQDVAKIVPGYGVGSHVAGGYVNWDSGWGDAEASVRFAKQKLDALDRVDFRTGEVRRLIYSSLNEQGGSRKVTGVELVDGSSMSADLVILATGAWTGKLIDLRGRAEATGQVIAYIRITDQEQAQLANMPTLLSFCTGMFIIPPRNNLLKIARHAYGYRNPIAVPDPSPDSQGGEKVQVSLPAKGAPIPLEGEVACRNALKEMLPAFGERPFAQTRICWYTDTPTGDFIISRHPEYNGLFIATGGSGHGFKFLPVIGDKIVDAIEGKLDPELGRQWAWPEQQLAEDGVNPAIVWTEDGSRSGAKGFILAQELEKTKKQQGRTSRL
ncbi:hypothetical protein FQN57_000040 [Myotisia sp. PD_48]|nr:hypothetical protein FQN57_000040 [Myotisia sp. PD_48]